jgi:hypothetical protein
MTDKKKHPSGRPLTKNRECRLSIIRIPEKGALTPRLREDRRDLSLVGFHHSFQEKNNDESDE